MSKIKTTLKEPDIDNRMLDDRGVTPERLRRPFYVQGQSPIERAVARGTISEQHGRAAQKLHHHWRGAKWTTIGTNWKSEIWPGGVFDRIPLAPTELAAHHRDKIHGAIKAIHQSMDKCGMSRDAINLLFSVVCDEMPFEISGKVVWPRMGENAAAARAITYVRGALRVLSIEWGV